LLKVLIIIGTRPEIIKTSILHKLLLDDENFESILCSTGQHKELVTQACSSFNIHLDVKLDAMAHNTSMATQMAYIMSSLKGLIEKEKPTLILVQGDTLSAYCGALTAFHNKIALGHIESGLRTFNKWAPFPEEIYRCHIDSIADYHFAPTDLAMQNLLNEGHTTRTCFLTGNTGIDALLHIRNTLNKDHSIIKDEILKLTSSTKKKILLTLHRRESHGQIINQIMSEVVATAEEQDIQVVFPLHPNPALENLLKYKSHPLINIIEPVDYSTMVWLMMQCDLILSDSGGLQEEAPYLGKRVLVLRNETERTEVLSEQTNQLYTLGKLNHDVAILLKGSQDTFENIYGDGNASNMILDILKSNLL